MRARVLPVWFLIVGTLLLPGCLGASQHDAAGIVAYSTIQGRTYVLLADHPGTDRGWGTFGGHREAKETLAETAAREFREETRCVYGDYPSAEDLAGLPRVERGNFVSYVIEVPYVPAQVFASLEEEGACTGPAFEERGPWVWIPLDVLRGVFQDAESTKQYDLPSSYVPLGSPTVFWDKSATVVERAVDEGLLPLGAPGPANAGAATSHP